MLKMMSVVAATALAAPAMAAPATVTVTGTVMSGVDAGGRFGAAGASLAGLPFSAVFTIDAGSGATLFQTATIADLFGTGAASPVGAVLTIGAGSYRFAGSYAGRARASDSAGRGGTDAVEYFVEDTDFSQRPNSNTLLSLGFDTLRDVLAGTDVTAVDATGLTLADNAKGFVKIANRDPATGTFGAATYADLAVGTIRAQAAAAVPEPATWAMMVAGFALAGAALRRRPRTTARVRFA